LGCTLAYAAPKDSTAPSAPDILLVVIDSLRADYLGCYGQTLPTTPVIDALAASGVRFNNAIASAPWTEPSIMTVFTSLPPDRHGLVLSTVPFVTNGTTLAECLSQAGYQTVGITANPSTHRRRGFARGFDHYDDYTVAMDPGGDLALAAAQAAAQTATGATVTRLAEDWLRRRDPAKPLFLFLHYMDPHWDYVPPAAYCRLFTDDPVPPLRKIYMLGKTFVPPLARKRIRAAYAGEIRYTDDCIGRLLDAIRATPRSSAMAVALCGDHGEAFWEHGCVGHGNNFHEEEIHVPLIIRPPGPPAAGAVVPGQVGLIDLAPTLVDIAGVKPSPDWEGISLRPLLTGGAVLSRPVVLDNRIQGGHIRGVRTSTFKVIGRPPFDAPCEVYDLVADPGETNNLVGSVRGIPPTATSLIPLLRTSDITASESKGITP
jgi:arylsulfatase A-like enzyme